MIYSISFIDVKHRITVVRQLVAVKFKFEMRKLTIFEFVANTEMSHLPTVCKLKVTLS